MARFRFNLEPLLKLRRFEEEAAQRALADALRAVEAQKSRIGALEAEREELLAAEGRKREYVPAERQRMIVYLASLERRLNDARRELQNLEAAVLARREELNQAAKARKALERLRERRREAFTAEVRRREYAEVDEAVLQRMERETGDAPAPGAR